MGETFQGIMGNFNGYALEDSNFNPQSDDSNIDGFFNDDQNGEVINTAVIKKGRIKRIRKKKSTKQKGTFGGF